MGNSYYRTPLWQVSSVLSAVATGRTPAELVLRDVRLINVCTREIQEHLDVAVAAGRIALVGDASHCIGPDTIVVEAAGRYLAPGFLDGHMHLESSMLTFREYAATVIPHGTVGVYADPHEICNVTGLAGVRQLMAEAATTPLKALLTVPSCVPSMPNFEDTGAAVTAADVAEAMTWDNTVGLGEMMNYPGMISGAEEPCAITAQALKAGGVVTGHFPISDTPRALNAYIAAGIRCCHESTRAEDALAKMRLGMYAQLREGSAWKDLHAVAPAVTAGAVDSRFACLVSDDAHPAALRREGHLDHLLLRAMEEGIDPITAVQMVTLNTAQCFRMEQDLGSVTPGKCADLVLLDRLDAGGVMVSAVWIDGTLVAQDGAPVYQAPPFTFAPFMKDTLHLGDVITPASFRISAQGQAQPLVRVIQVLPAQAGTLYRQIPMEAQNGLLEADPNRDLLKAAVFERHHATGRVGYGFVTGFGLKRGALAQTVAHDAHNLLVVGSSDVDMAVAANALLDCGGGACAVCDGQVLARVPLPVGGLMSDLPVEQVAAQVEALEDAWRTLGCQAISPFMTMGLISLPCLPELRLTDRGLVDCVRYCQVSLLADRSGS